MFFNMFRLERIIAEVANAAYQAAHAANEKLTKQVNEDEAKLVEQVKGFINSD